MTFALAIIVFVVVQVTAFKSQGVKARLKHLAGPSGGFRG
jgi:F0F1-type ATP synthase membrane subunit a